MTRRGRGRLDCAPADADAPRRRVAAAVALDERTGVGERIPTTRIILACGHSARDTFEMVRDAGVLMERKPFAVGVRIEHPQALIDRVQHGVAAGHRRSARPITAGRPHACGSRRVHVLHVPGRRGRRRRQRGGWVCVNGMSRHARAGANANSALLVGVEPDDLPGDDVLAGVALQRELERAAFRAGRAHGAADYTAPPKP